MGDLDDGASIEVKGSAAQPYVLRNTGGVYSCTCPAWRNQSIAIEQRTCKHLKSLRGAEAESQRVGTPPPPALAHTSASSEDKAPPLLLAHSWDGQADLAGWWMSEKLDGVRAYWDGTTFVSRLGNPFHAPDWFVAGLPDTPLDGELWSGRRRFQRTISIVRRQDRSDHWREVTYVVFDAPGLALPFEERLEACRQLLAARQPPYARFHEHARCEGAPHLRRELARVEE